MQDDESPPPEEDGRSLEEILEERRNMKEDYINQVIYAFNLKFFLMLKLGTLVLWILIAMLDFDFIINLQSNVIFSRYPAW